jgi:glycosyltransferase involved in cell wall biosynthesis
LDSILISIILPTYNRIRFIPQAIESVLKQTYTNWELIIIDDGSTDGTERIVNEYLNENSRIRYYRQPKKGASAARNFGLNIAKGSYVTFLDSDDIYHPDKLNVQLYKALECNSRIVLCFSDIVENNVVIRTKKPIEVDDLKSSLLKKVPNVYAGTPLLFVDSTLIHQNKVRFDESLPAMQDFDFLISLSEYSNYKVVNEVLYTENRFAIERVHSVENVFLAELMLYRKYSDIFNNNLIFKLKWIRKSVSIYHYYKYVEHREKLYSAYSTVFDRVVLLSYLAFLKLLRPRVRNSTCFL